MSCCDQLPFIVSQIPYRTANPANSQNPAGSLPLPTGVSGGRGLRLQG